MFCPDSVTSTCFKVTYAGGRMCSHWKKSEDEPCSITYPSGDVSTNVLYKHPSLCCLSFLTELKYL